MKNIETTLVGNKLTLTIDLGLEYGPSKTGKSIVIASSEGNQAIPGMENIKFGVNVYRK